MNQENCHQPKETTPYMKKNFSLSYTRLKLGDTTLKVKNSMSSLITSLSSTLTRNRHCQEDKLHGLNSYKISIFKSFTSPEKRMSSLTHSPEDLILTPLPSLRPMSHF